MLDTKMVQFARRPALPEPKPMELLCNGFTRLLFQLLFDETQINYEKVWLNKTTFSLVSAEPPNFRLELCFLNYFVVLPRLVDKFS